ncbi:TonB-dependent receptor [Bacteroides pyogenes F0041]|uniref:TonB-dependent receptor n=2 Tax=Bacteroides pyogenes TaxID=310300 RepID=U2DJK2_9BACE|nr:TonB-dependent receptor [Bacteroides pyogenes F0041]
MGKTSILFPTKTEKKRPMTRIAGVLLALLFISSSVFSQESEKQITIEFNGEKLASIFERIEKESGYRIIFNYEDIARYESSGIAKSKPISEVLRLVIGNKPLTFSIEGKFITIALVQERAVLPIRKKRCELNGIVVDEHKQPLPGAHIAVAGTNLVTSTQQDGIFRLSVDNQQTSYILKVSYLGMLPQEVKVSIEFGSEEKSIPMIILKEDEGMLGEIVVTGYQVMSRRESASAITSIKAQDVLTPNAMGIDQMLQGKVPGMMVMTQSGEPSSTPAIRIRGNSTINGSKTPVWVVDGIIMSDAVPFTSSDLNSPDAAYLIGNGISGISPQDIESIDILKDAAATAIYGVKAANGVIVVTTKKGKVSRPVISYTGDLTINTRPAYSQFDMMNSQERIRLSKEIYDERLEYPRMPMGESFEGALQRLLSKQITQEQFAQLVRKYETINTDWFDELFRTTVTQNHSLSANGGTERMKYYASLAYNSSPGIALKSKSERFTALAKVSVQINKRIDAELKIDVSSQNNDGYHTSVNPFRYAYGTSRAVSHYDEEGNYYYYSRQRLNPVSYNILNELNQTGQVSKTNRFGGTLKLRARLFKGITYEGVFSLGQSNNRLTSWATDRSYVVGNIRGYDYGAYTPEQDKYKLSPLPFGGTYADTHTNARSYTIRNTLNYISRFNDKHDINLFAGVEVRSEKYTGLSTDAYGWNPKYGNTFSPVMTDAYLSYIKAGRFLPRLQDRITQVASYFGTFSYTFDDRYVINANIRSDGSNKFGSNPKYRWLPTWSVAGKWSLSNEAFIKELRFINELHLRGSYGIQGNIHDDSSPYLIVKMERNNTISGLTEGSIYHLPNPDLRWEKTRSYNFGMDAKFFDRRLGITLDYYRKYTSDLITDMRVSPITGKSSMLMNVGTARNKGFEGSVSADLIRTKKFDWNLSLNFSRNINEIEYAFNSALSETEVLQQMLYGNVATIGQPLGTIYSFKYEGLSAENGYPLFLAADGRKVHEGDYQAMAYVPSGSIYPDISGGFDTRFTYKKNLTLSLGFSYQLGGVKRLPAIYEEADKAFDPISNVPRDYINRWRKPGDELHTDIPALYDKSRAKNFPETLLALYDTGTSRDLSMPALYDKSDLRIAKSDFIRLRTIQVSYRLPSTWLAPLQISSLTVRAQANNLKTWASKAWKGLDPETPYANMPVKPSYSFGVNVSF